MPPLKARSVCLALLAVNTKAGSVWFLHLQEEELGVCN